MSKRDAQLGGGGGWCGDGLAFKKETPYSSFYTRPRRVRTEIGKASCNPTLGNSRLNERLPRLRANLIEHHRIYCPNEMENGMSTRSLQIESSGDFWRRDIKPKIRLAGKWLERAGFKPGHRVTVEIGQPGTLTLHFLEQSSPPR